MEVLKPPQDPSTGKPRMTRRRALLVLAATAAVADGAFWQLRGPTPVWVFRTGGWVDSSPVVVGDVVCVGSEMTPLGKAGRGELPGITKSHPGADPLLASYSQGMDPVTLLTVVGTCAGVMAAVVAVLQLRRTPTLSDAESLGVESRPQAVLAGEGGGMSATSPSPVVLRAPTGRLGEVRGRDEILSVLDRLLAAPDSRFHVLTGLGGAGKTTIALALAERAQRQGRASWWVNATHGASVTGALLTLAADLGAPVGQVEEARAGRRNPADVLWDRLQGRSGWLLVVDNADDPGGLTIGNGEVGDGTGWLRPTTAGLIVVTSRVAEPRVWGRYGMTHTMSSLPEPDGARILLDLAPGGGTEQQAAALSRRLGGLPLALTHAGAYIAAPFSEERTFDAYLHALNDRLPLLMGDTPVVDTWEVSLDALAAQGYEQARPLLRVLSCFAPSVEVNSVVLDSIVLGEICGGPSRVRPGLDALLSLNLIGIRPVPGQDRPGVVVHPIVADACRLQLTTQITSVAARAMDAAVRGLKHDHPSDWPTWLGVMPHAVELVHIAPAVLDDSGLAAVARSTARVCRALKRTGAYGAAADIAAAALWHAEGLGAAHPAVLDVRYALGAAKSCLGRSVEAEHDLRDTLKARARILGPEHPDTLAAHHEMAHALIGQGRYADAVAAYQEVLELRERVLGKDHLDTLSTRHEVGRTLGNLGRFAASETACRDVLVARLRVLGPDHPDTLESRYYLTRAIGEQGQYAAAERAFSELAADRTRILGAEHPQTLKTRFNMIWQIASQGRHQEAETAYRELSQVQGRVLGQDHPDALLTRLNLGMAMIDLGRPAEAESECADVFSAWRRVGQPEHPFALGARWVKALAVASLGRPAEAETELSAVLKIQQQVLGDDHPDVLDARRDLCRILVQLGRDLDAACELDSLVGAYRRVRGVSHPDTRMVETERAALRSGETGTGLHR
ncbi:FxSxx-COOH system tetratricopeptide repeat protein [Acrocarpospora sp. B8E8]|uniref:FxSxx-COOH system tetratricopeptide repeat protein n=1 Tax=Acrocarpospora sp. B8E8 TaxID=3153572 RepID=UPI00325E9374